MKVVKLTPKALDRWPVRGRARKCVLCHRKLRPGQHVLNHRLPGSDFTDPVINIHVACVRAAVADIPPDDVDPTDPAALWENERATMLAGQAA